MTASAIRGIALVSTIALVGVAVALAWGAPNANAAFGSELGRHVYGTGTVVGVPLAANTQDVTVDATVDFSGSVSGTVSIATDGGPPSLGIVTCMFVVGSSALLGVEFQPAPQASPPPSQWQYVSVTDGGLSGTADTLWVSAIIGGVDCTLGPQPGNDLTSGDFVVEALPQASFGPSPTPNPDSAPADGIVDSLQPAGTAAGSFLDASLAPPTYGSIVSTAGLDVTVSDAPNPEGVTITVGGAPVASGAPIAQAELSICGFTVFLSPGTTATPTCGSLSLTVSSGTATVVLGGGLTTTVSIPAGGEVTVTELADGSFTVAVEAAGTEPVSVTVDGTTVVIPAGSPPLSVEAWDFVGFSQPVDNLPTLNRVKAGQAVPLRWRLLDGAGVPITNLSSANITVTNLDCASATTIDQIEELVAFASPLQNLGRGYYQLNWTSLKSYALSCKTLHLDIGDGVTHEARFRFTR